MASALAVADGGVQVLPTQPELVRAELRIPTSLAEDAVVLNRLHARSALLTPVRTLTFATSSPASLVRVGGVPEQPAPVFRLSDEQRLLLRAQIRGAAAMAHRQPLR